MTAKRIELRGGDVVWGTLCEDQNGVKSLDLAPELTEPQIDSYTGGLAPYDRDGEPLQIQQAVEYVYLNDRHGNTHLRLRMNSNGEIVDVQHPLVALMVLLSGPGNVENCSIQPGMLLFRFRWK
jgi:hypothetical protein